MKYTIGSSYWSEEDSRFNYVWLRIIYFSKQCIQTQLHRWVICVLLLYVVFLFLVSVFVKLYVYSSSPDRWGYLFLLVFCQFLCHSLVLCQCKHFAVCQMYCILKDVNVYHQFLEPIKYDVKKERNCVFCLYFNGHSSTIYSHDMPTLGPQGPMTIIYVQY